MKNISGLIKTIAYLILTFIVGIVIYSFISTQILKKDYTNIFGYTYYSVATGSMKPVISPNDLIFVKITKNVSKGDIITFKDSGSIVTHRLIDINNNKYITKGDANNTSDTGISKSDIIGKVVYIITPDVIFKGIVVILIFIIFIVILNFDRLYDKLFGEDSRYVNKSPDNIFSSNKNSHSGLTVTIPLDEVKNIKTISDKVVIHDKVNVIDNSINDIVTHTNNNLKSREEDLLKLVNDLLRIKNSKLSTSRINKSWLAKYHYIYKIGLTLYYNDTNSLKELVLHPDFTEIYDYDLVKIGLYENLRNRIYEMPIDVFLKILVYSILYNDEEFFDGIFKIMKYKILVDKDNNFKCIRDNNSKKNLKELINFMEKVPDKFDNKNVFELDKIERLIKIKCYPSK
jgi:signal peptidase I